MMDADLPLPSPAARAARPGFTIETSFTAIRVEGGLFPAEFLQRVAKQDAAGQADAAYDVPPGRSLRDEIGRYWTIAEALWGEYRRDRLREDLPASRTGVERWLVRLLREVLGYTDLAPCPEPQVADRGFPIRHRAHGGAVPLLLTTHAYALDRSDRAFGDDGRRRAPHAAMQEYLNADRAATWGLVANGNHLRLLRDNPSLTRPAYVEVDLERIFEEDLYPDFAALFLIAHASRTAPGAGGMAGCWLERWRLEGAKTGERALKRLRVGVTTALRELGSGFVEHPQNDALRIGLRDGAVSADVLHQQLLRLVYRLLFLFTTEERDLLHAPEATPEARAVYAQGYGLGRLRERARRKRYHDIHTDLWAGLTVTFRALARGAPSLGLPALGGLFEPDQCPLLDACALPNKRLLAAIYALAYFEDNGGLAKVNYRDMGTEELGSVYESLLELHPLVRVEVKPWTFAFVGDEAAGDARASERRLSGSYYTPDSLVVELLRASLDPLIAKTLATNPANPREALLRLRIIDPACGSGHFLLGAARRLADAVARLDMDGDLPDEAVRRHALREVVRRCIYGVDRNPLSVELCRTALWIEAIEPGRPLSFLDAHIRCGDALVGVTDFKQLATGIADDAYEAFIGDDKAAATTLRKLNKVERDSPPPTMNLGLRLPADLAAGLDALSTEPDDDLTAITRKRERFEALRSGPVGWRLKVACDIWTAAFFAEKKLGEIKGRELCPTTGAVWRYLQGGTLYGPLVAEADRLAQHYRFFHWPLEFPDVMRDGGFDLICGNPPWETTSPDAKEFFAVYDPRVRFMSKEEQTVAFARLKQHASIAARWHSYRRDLYLQNTFYRASRRYSLFTGGKLGGGDLNLYRMFAESALRMTKPGGRIAQLVPEGFYNGANTTALRKAFLEECRVEWLIGFANYERIWFPEIYYRMKFCIYVAERGGRTDILHAAFNVLRPSQLVAVVEGNRLEIPVAMIREFSPDTMTVMEVAAQQDIDICRKMYARYPKFGERIAGQSNRVYMTEVHMGGDRELFPEGAEGLPLLEGRMVDLYDYRAKAYVSGRARAAVWAELPFGDPHKAIVPQWRVPPEMIPDRLLGRINQYRIGFCDVASPTNERSLIAALIPPDAVCGHSVPTIVLEGGGPADMMFWLGVANTLCMDFIVRKRVALHLTFTIMDSLPFPRDWRSTPAAEAIIARAFTLSACGPEMEGFRATAPGTPGIPADLAPVEDPDARARLMAEIEVLVAREVYGLSRDDLLFLLDPDNILGRDCGVETFKALRNRENRDHGEYLTQRLVLEAWDRLVAESDGAASGVRPNDVRT
jgi:hypothetical protein